MRPSLPILVALLGLGVACRRPEPAPKTPAWQGQVEAAARAFAATRKAEGGEEAYLGDFRTGAAMVDDALRTGWIPTHVGRVGLDPQLPGAPRVEVDPGTGFPVAQPMDEATIAGFEWALGVRQADLHRRRLLSAMPLPAAPAPEAWQAWTSGHSTQVCALPGGRMEVWAGGGMLGWEIRLEGLPTVRGWRPHKGAAPRFLAFASGAVWIDAPGPSIAALDPVSGRVRQVLAAPAWSPALEASVKRVEAPRRSASGSLMPLPPALDPRAKAAEALVARARKGDVAAMVEVGDCFAAGCDGFPRDAARSQAWLGMAKGAGWTGTR